MKARIYISGPITGTDHYQEAFKKAEEELGKEGFETVNPASVFQALPDGMEYEEIMAVDLCLLNMCSSIYMLEGWEKSRGANREYGYALAKGMRILGGEPCGEQRNAAGTESGWKCSSNAAGCQNPMECRECSLNQNCHSCVNRFTEVCDICRNREGLAEVLTELTIELGHYKEIGTVKECREAVKKQKPEKPDVYGDGYGNDGSIIYDTYDCPNCGKSYEIDYEEYKHCPECGQAIDWGGRQ